MKTLHVIRDPNERLALELAERESERDTVSLLLIQDGVLARPLSERVTLYVLADTTRACGVADQSVVVDDNGAVRLIAEHDRVVVW